MLTNYSTPYINSVVQLTSWVEELWGHGVDFRSTKGRSSHWRDSCQTGPSSGPTRKQPPVSSPYRPQRSPGAIGQEWVTQLGRRESPIQQSFHAVAEILGGDGTEPWPEHRNWKERSYTLFHFKEINDIISLSTVAMGSLLVLAEFVIAVNSQLCVCRSLPLAIWLVRTKNDSDRPANFLLSDFRY